MDRIFISLGSTLGAIAVGLGAFGAHSLRRRWTRDRLNRLEIGIRYQLYHALALLVVGLILRTSPGAQFAELSGWLILGGTLVFSGSLYLLVISGRRWLGAITPVGGLALILGWIALLLHALLD